MKANRQLTGGEAAPGGLFDEDAQNQRTLFQPAYHGSPHIFDQFSNEKIGTGEGAQAYGHGLYFAGKKEVAQWYRNNLAGQQGLRLDGKEIHEAVGRSAAPVNEAIKKAPAILESLGELPTVVPAVEGRPDYKGYAGNATMRALALRDVLHTMEHDVGRLGKSVADAAGYWSEKAISANDKAIEWAKPEDQRGPAFKTQTPEAATTAANNWRKMADESTLRAQIAKALSNSGRVTIDKPGRLYHVDVPEDHELLDWDKPLSEQPEGVREKLSGLGIKPRESRRGSRTPAPLSARSSRISTVLRSCSAAMEKENSASSVRVKTIG